MSRPGRGQVNELAVALQRHFARLGYREHAAVALTAAGDPSVLFTGSVTSLLKPFLIERRIPGPGLFALQPALRTRNLDTVLDDEVRPTFCSYFPAFGTLAPPDRLDAVGREVAGFFRDVLGVAERLVVRAASVDDDLLGSWRSPAVCGSLELDGCAAERYRHRYGLDGVSGRNYNFAFRTARGLEDFGNVILIEAGGVPIGVELALGLTTLLARLHGAAHPIWFSPISEHLAVDSSPAIKLADSVAVVIALLREGLRPVVTNRGRVLRRYLQAVGHLRMRLGVTLDQIEVAAEHYEVTQFGASTRQARKLRCYLERHAELVASGATGAALNRGLAGVI